MADLSEAVFGLTLIEAAFAIFFGWLSSDYMKLLWRIKMQKYRRRRVAKLGLPPAQVLEVPTLDDLLRPPQP